MGRGFVTIKAACIASLGSTGILTMSQLPVAQIVAPDNLKDWPAVAILGAVTLASLSLVFYMFREVMKVAKSNSDGLVKSAEAIDRLSNSIEKKPCIIELEDR